MDYDQKNLEFIPDESIDIQVIEKEDNYKNCSFRFKNHKLRRFVNRNLNKEDKEVIQAIIGLDHIVAKPGLYSAPTKEIVQTLTSLLVA